jgi:hypothetical protein
MTVTLHVQPHSMQVGYERLAHFVAAPFSILMSHFLASSSACTSQQY